MLKPRSSHDLQERDGLYLDFEEEEDEEDDFEDEEDDEYGYDFATFNSDNTGTCGEYYYNGRNWVYDDVESFTYAIVRKETSETGYQLLTLRLYFGDEVETLEVEVLSSNKVVVDGDIFIKQ